MLEGVVVEDAGRDAHGRRMYRVITPAEQLAAVREEIRATEAKRAELEALAKLAATPAQGRA
jgi:hypothetical protein